MSNNNYTTQFSQEELEKEEWRSVVGFEGSYSVSNLGRVRRNIAENNTYAGRILNPSKDNNKNFRYLRVHLVYGPIKKYCTVHSLVAASFLGPCPDKLQINHIDGIKTNNRIVNLEYITQPENMAHAKRVGLLPHRTHCKMGHELTPDNITSEDRRRCRICQRKHSLKSYYKRQQYNKLNS
jgi:hypothetical protein